LKKYGRDSGLNVVGNRQTRGFFTIASAHFAGVKSIQRCRVSVRSRVTRGPENVKMSVAHKPEDRSKSPKKRSGYVADAMLLLSLGSLR
jgi:hypothetical protein